MNVEFTTVDRLVDGRLDSYVRFTRETSGKNGRFYIVNVDKSGGLDFQVNYQRVDRLPNYAPTRDLLQAVECHKGLAVDWLNSSDPDEKNRLWWVMKERMREQGSL